MKQFLLNYIFQSLWDSREDEQFDLKTDHKLQMNEWDPLRSESLYTFNLVNLCKKLPAPKCFLRIQASDNPRGQGSSTCFLRSLLKISHFKSNHPMGMFGVQPPIPQSCHSLKAIRKGA
jgi:hypothetical protein